MIPKNITSAHVKRALADLDRDGVPLGRESRAYDLMAGRRRYPPKLVLALANRHANGVELLPNEFSGGAESNNVLVRLGFNVVATASRSAPVRRGPRIATVILETDGGYDTGRRLSAAARIIRAVGNAVAGNVVVSLSGGWFKGGARRPMTILDPLVRDVRRQLRGVDGRVALTLGIDGRYDADQLAMAVTRDGIVAMGRKFHPTLDEKDHLDAAADWAAGEAGYPRIASLFGRRLFLAVCYDGFGIKHRHLPKPDVDAVIDHVHSFRPRGSAGSGDVLFARHGLAGASQEWGVPAFAAVRFIDRWVPKDWPSGVMWKGRRGSTTAWTYARNALAPEQVLAIETDVGRAVVRVFPPLQ